MVHVVHVGVRHGACHVVIHVKSPGFAGRLPELTQIPRSPGRENESPGFLSSG